MDERYAVSLGRKFQHPVQSGVAATEDHQPLTMEVARILDPVVNRGAFEEVGTLDTNSTRLKRAEACGDHYRAGVEDLARCRANLESPVVATRKFDHFLAEVKLR